MTLVDTSAWVEYLRGTGSHAHLGVRRLLDSSELLHTTEVVVMEVLAGARSDAHATQLHRLLSRCEFAHVQGLRDFEQAAELYRRCRRSGHTIRALNDCLVAAVATRLDLTVLHADRDFDALARHSELRLIDR
jgi:predicted nucleic acid-binding protein